MATLDRKALIAEHERLDKLTREIQRLFHSEYPEAGMTITAEGIQRYDLGTLPYEDDRSIVSLPFITWAEIDDPDILAKGEAAAAARAQVSKDEHVEWERKMYEQLREKFEVNNAPR